MARPSPDHPFRRGIYPCRTYLTRDERREIIRQRAEGEHAVLDADVTAELALEVAEQQRLTTSAQFRKSVGSGINGTLGMFLGQRGRW